MCADEKEVALAKQQANLTYHAEAALSNTVRQAQERLEKTQQQNRECIERVKIAEAAVTDQYNVAAGKLAQEAQSARDRESKSQQRNWKQ